MPVVLVLIGLLLGALLFAGSGHGFAGALIGGTLGLVLSQVVRLQRRVRALELEREVRDVPDLAREPAPAAASRPAPGPEPTAGPAPPEPIAVPTRAATGPAGASPPAGPAAARSAAASAAPSSPAPAAPAQPPPALPSWVDRATAAAKTWITTGNVPVKVGVIVSFFGVAFLLKYAVDRELLKFPIELRLILVAIAGMVLLAFGWRLRRRARVYALSLQGGGVGILYLTLFAAYRLYDLLPTLPTFALLVLLTAFAGVLAVVQNARGLAILGIVGGFLAPILVSTSAGNHVALFSYYLVLNAAILGIARFRAWRELNLLGWLFTFGVGSWWGAESYRPEHFATTEPFLIAHFLFYQGVAILFALRQPPRLKGLVDGTLVFGTPVVTFAMQSVLLEGDENGMALSALAVAVFYVLVAAWLHRTHRELRVLGESYVALAVAFGTLAIPLALDGHWTGAAWALEGAALVWIGCRQSRLLAKLTGGALILFAGCAFSIGGWQHPVGPPLANANVTGGLLIAVSSLFAARRLDGEGDPFWHKLLAVLLFAWGALWWLIAGQSEIARVVDEDGLEASLLHLAASALATSLLAERSRWQIARVATLAYLPLLALWGLLFLGSHAHPLEGWGWLAWPVAWLVQIWILRAGEAGLPRFTRLWQTATAVGFPLFVAWEVLWRLRHAELGAAWVAGGGGAVLVLAAWLIVALRRRVLWPLARNWPFWAAAAGILAVVGLLYFSAISLALGGDPAPLPYVPLLNPLDLATLLALLSAAAVLRGVRGVLGMQRRSLVRGGFTLLAALAFLMSTAAVVRGVHLLADVRWRTDDLAASVAVQAALSIYWGLLAFAGMVWGARRSSRAVWMTGAALMGVVVLKLFAVDLGNTGTVARIVSFIGVGALLLVVGYFAPAPPSRSRSAPAEEETEP